MSVEETFRQRVALAIFDAMEAGVSDDRISELLERFADVLDTPDSSETSSGSPIYLPPTKKKATKKKAKKRK